MSSNSDKIIDISENTNKKQKCRNNNTLRVLIVIISLYIFLFGLGLMSDSFKALSGKGVGSIFNRIDNPIAGLSIGILGTVLLQSSSTTTSIIVSMVGTNVLDVSMAIPVIMGANIGTSSTNSIVALGQLHDMKQFRLAFSAATVHDIFNILSVAVLLPIEMISNACGFALLENLTLAMTQNLVGINSKTFKSPLKYVVAPLIKKIITIDKNLIKSLANGCLTCNTTNSQQRSQDIITSGIFKTFGDIAGSICALILSIVVLCIALYFMVKTLQKLVLDNKQGCIIKGIKKTLSINGYLSMLFGLLLTVAVQSSSVTTSTFVPLVGLSIITIEQMLPLTLGANLGTTFTAFLSALVTSTVPAIQIALCHLFFNIFGILIWYPIPKMRSIPIKISNHIGNLAVSRKWFALFYMVYIFILIPLLMFGTSMLFEINTICYILAVTFLILILFFSIWIFVRFKMYFP